MEEVRDYQGIRPTWLHDAVWVIASTGARGFIASQQPACPDHLLFRTMPQPGMARTIRFDCPSFLRKQESSVFVFNELKARDPSLASPSVIEKHPAGMTSKTAPSQARSRWTASAPRSPTAASRAPRLSNFRFVSKYWSSLSFVDWFALLSGQARHRRFHMCS